MRTAILFIFLFSVGLHASVWDSFSLRENGSLPVWLVAGPFPNKGATKDHGENCSGYLKDYLVASGGEPQTFPVEGDVVTYDSKQVTWKSAISDDAGLLDFIDLCNVDQQTPGVVYAYSNLYSETGQEIRFKIRSDDGVRVWLNSGLIHDHHVGRGIEDEEDTVPAHLNKGNNTLMVKVDQGDGGWALQLRIHNREGRPVQDLSNRVRLEKQLSGKIKSVDVLTNPVMRKGDTGPQNELILKLASGGLGDVSCTLTKDEWPEPVTLQLGSIPLGNQEYVVEVPKIAQAGTVTVDLESPSDRAQLEAGLKPVKEWRVYLLHHSHVDIGYTHVQEDVERYQWQHLEKALEYARRSADYPAGSQFKWNTEVLWAVDGYLRQASEEKKEQFFDAVKKGWIGIDGLFGNELTGLCRPEELMQLVELGRRLGEETGLPVTSAMISDVPGYTWSMVPVMAQYGIKYFSIGPNPGHRIGSTLKTWGDRPFYWVSPSGEEKVLCWISSRGYASFHTGLNMTENLRRISNSAIFDYLLELNANDFPYDMTYLRYNIGSDNGPPDAMLADFAKEWNAKYESPELIIATTAEMFSAFEAEYGDMIPSVSGDFTPYWEDGAASSALETSINRDNAERLIQAEKIWSMLDPEKYPREEFDDAWRNVILYDEHTWGSWNSISEPEAEFTLHQWNVKQAFAMDADRQSKKLLKEALASVADHSKTVRAVQVFNTASWPRSDIVMLPADWNVPGETVKDENGAIVLSQKLTDGCLAFLAERIPPMGSAKFTIHKGSPGVNGNVSVAGSSIKNTFVAVDIDPRTGSISSLRTIDGNRIFELVDREKGKGLNEYFYVEGRDPSNTLPAGKTRICIKENGPLVASLLVESDAPGCNGLSREIRVMSGINRVDIINTIDKKKIYEKEGVHFAFPFNVPEGQMRVDIGWGHYRPEAEQLPGACKNYLTVQRWVDISNQDYGITWVTNDAPMIEVGEITADPVAFGWIDHLEPSQTIYSYVMNNYWETNYKASQEGPVTFRYSIQPHGRFNPAESQRSGLERSQPLIAVPVNPQSGAVVSLFTVEPSTVMVSSAKPLRDGKTLLVRLFNAGGRPETVSLKCSESPPARMYSSSPSAEKGEEIRGGLAIPAYGIRTVRMEWD